MLLSKILRAKRFFTKKNGDQVVDLISSSYDFEKTGTVEGFIRVQEDEKMRPDLISIRMYSDQSKWDSLLKYNGISNPFSVDQGEIFIIPPFRGLEEMIIPPATIPEKGKELAKTNETKLLAPKTVKDAKRIEALKTRVKEIVPPNVNTSGNQNVKVRGGRVIFGEDVTQAGVTTQNPSLSRARVIQQLSKSNQQL
jgi:hypothetical protein